MRGGEPWLMSYCWPIRCPALSGYPEPREQDPTVLLPGYTAGAHLSALWNVQYF
jgi:hypothetical protein